VDSTQVLYQENYKPLESRDARTKTLPTYYGTNLNDGETRRCAIYFLNLFSQVISK
jgi:hypothetical protein